MTNSCNIGLFGSTANKRKTMGGSGGKSSAAKSSVGEALASSYWLSQKELDIGANLLRKVRAPKEADASKADVGESKKTKDEKKGEKVEKIVPLTVKTVTEGTLLLGVVKRVTRRQMFVALPYGMSGVVSFSEIADGALLLGNEVVCKVYVCHQGHHLM